MKSAAAAVIISVSLLLAHPLCAEEHFFCISNDAVVLEYKTVYDVHVAPDTNQYPNIRIQPGGFDKGRILSDLQKYLVTTNCDFVLMYSLHELPGWINSGGSYSQPLGKNIGFPNSMSGQSRSPTGWPKLRSTPHMNSVGFIEGPVRDWGGTWGGTLTAFHECFHCWGPNITRNQTVGPREWKPGDPIAWLGQCCSHWSWNFVEPGLPGIMYSAPTTNRFNAFDLYIMGLMPYSEASQFYYTIYELGPGSPSNTNLHHQLRLDDLIYALSLTGANYYEGDGRRIPDLDPSVSAFEALIVVIKGQDEQLTQGQVELVSAMARDIPGAWGIAMWGRSAMRTKAFRKPLNDTEGLHVHVERAGPGFNVFWQSRADSDYQVLYSADLNQWEEATRVRGSGAVENVFYTDQASASKFFRLLEFPRQ
jgi:hypothetical protein